MGQAGEARRKGGGRNDSERTDERVQVYGWISLNFFRKTDKLNQF